MAMSFVQLRTMSKVICAALLVAILVMFDSSTVNAGVLQRQYDEASLKDFHDGFMQVSGRNIPCGRRSFSRESRKMDDKEPHGVAAAIVGGSDAQPGEFPFIVSLTHGDQDKHFCGGSLIGPRHVLTASHCFEVRRNNLKVHLREYDINRSERPPAMTFRPSAVIRHPSWNAKNYANDLAMIVLDEEFPRGDYAQLICLPSRTVSEEGLDWMAGKKLTVAGWGATQERGKLSPILQKLDVPVVENASCRKNMSFAFDVNESQLCAGYPGGKKDACQGDSGGPLFRFDKNGIAILEGVVSAGIGCARAGLPGIYTRTAAYLPWIEGILKATSTEPSIEHKPSEKGPSSASESEIPVISTTEEQMVTTTTGRAMGSVLDYGDLFAGGTGNQDNFDGLWLGAAEDSSDEFGLFDLFRQSTDSEDQEEPAAAGEGGDDGTKELLASLTSGDEASDYEAAAGDDVIGRAYRNYRDNYWDYFSNLNKALARLYPTD